MSQQKYRYGTTIDELYILIDRLESELSFKDISGGQPLSQSAIHSSSDCFYSVHFSDGHPKKISFDISCLNVTGYTPEEFLENRALWNSIISDEHREMVSAFESQITLGQYPGVLEYRIVRKDSQKRWVRITPVLFYHSDGSIRSYKGYVQDVTEYKVVCEERDESKMQLIHADKMKSLGVLVAGVAHEINNPNNLIAFNSDLLSRFWNELMNHHSIPSTLKVCGMEGSEFVAEYIKLIESVKEGSFRIKNIVESLKEFAQGDTGEYHDLVDVNGVINSSLFILSALLKSEGVEVSVQCDPNLPSVKGNFLQIEQVIINLLTNACQSSNRSDLHISIKTVVQESGVVVSVADNGDGIDELESIFDPFYTTKREDGGTGLGLSISYGIIKNHGGDMRFESTKGNGTTAFILFPQQGDFL
ncbi:MAG: ATP-binding protein [Fibrobacterales bacterium]